jgi:hypothetical protein
MVEVESHPPERRKRSTVLFAHGCCCCCCLHVVGGIGGAIFGSVRRHPPALETGAPDEVRTAHRTAVKAYWLALSLITLVAAVIAVLIDPSDSTVSLFAVGFFLPAVQLGASIATWIYILVRPPAKKSECLSRLGKITLWSFLGTLVGCVGVVLSFLTFGL